MKEASANAASGAAAFLFAGSGNANSNIGGGGSHGEHGFNDANGFPTRISASTLHYLLTANMAFLLSRYASLGQVEDKIEELGVHIGQRVLELLSVRSKLKRERRLVTMLQYVHTVVFKHLFNKPADGLERSTQRHDEFYIFDTLPFTNAFVSVPKEMGGFNPATFIAGIIRGVLTSAGFPCVITAHYQQLPNASTHILSTADTQALRTVYVIRFEEQVLKRDQKLPS